MSGAVRPYFTAQLRQAASDCGVRLRWFCDGWVAELTKAGRSKHVIGYWFPLNDAAAAQVANDKTATSVLLDASGVAAVAHHLLRPGAAPMDELVTRALALVPLPLVVKPLSESAGIDVLRARDCAELREAMRLLTTRHRAITVSPYVPIRHEYRVVLLDQRVRVVYEKLRGPDWRHNLHCGAVPELVGSADTVSALAALARQAVTVLNLRFAAVDIVELEGRLSVLEVNNTITLERFSARGTEYAGIAQDVYRAAVSACFARECLAGTDG